MVSEVLYGGGVVMKKKELIRRNENLQKMLAECLRCLVGERVTLTGVPLHNKTDVVHAKIERAFPDSKLPSVSIRESPTILALLLTDGSCFDSIKVHKYDE
jgi:hypothetical protein